MNPKHDLRTRKVQLIKTAVYVNAFCVDHRAHCAVKDANTIFMYELAKVIHKPLNKKPRAQKQREAFLVSCRFFSSFFGGASRLKSPRVYLSSKEHQPIQRL